MSSKKGPGRFVAAHQTEAARRALIQPVPCWEYKWVIPPAMPSGSTLRLRQWVKTSKRQEFSDDEDESQTALEALPDEPEQEAGEEEDDDEEKEDSAPAPSGVSTPLPAATSGLGVPGLDTPVSGAITPSSNEPPAPVNLAQRLRASENKPHPLSSSFGPDDMDTGGAENEETADVLPEDEANILDTIEMGMAVGMDGMDGMDVLEGEAYMDMLNGGNLDLGDDIMNGALGDPSQ